MTVVKGVLCFLLIVAMEVALSSFLVDPVAQNVGGKGCANHRIGLVEN